MALMGKRYQRTDGLKNIFTDATSGAALSSEMYSQISVMSRAASG